MKISVLETTTMIVKNVASKTVADEELVAIEQENCMNIKIISKIFQIIYL